MTHSTEAVYEAERNLCRILDRAHECPSIQIHGSTLAVQPDAKFGNIESVQRYVDKVLSLKWVQAAYPGAYRPITVIKRKGPGAATYSMNTIKIPDSGRASQKQWAMREIVVLHEIAHHLDTERGHTESFTGIFVDLVSNIISAETGFILRALFWDEGVRIAA